MLFTPFYIRRFDRLMPYLMCALLVCWGLPAHADEVSTTHDETNDDATQPSDSAENTETTTGDSDENPRPPAPEERDTTPAESDASDDASDDAPSAENNALDDADLGPDDDAELRALEEAIQQDQHDNEDSQDREESDVSAPHSASDHDADTRTGFQRAAQAVQNALNPEIALTLNLAAAYFSDSPMQMGHHDPNRNGFTFQELELAFSANVDPYFQFKGYLSASEHGVELEEAYAQTTSLPARLQLRAGKFLQRFGRINERHFHQWNFLDMPLVIGRFFGDEGLVGTGIEASWLAPTPWYLEIVFSAVHGDDARSFRGDDSSIESMRDFVYTGALKNHIAFDDDWSLSLGASAALGRNNAQWDPALWGDHVLDLPAHGLTQIYGGDLYLRYRPVDAPGYRAWSLQAEFLHRRRMVGGAELVSNGLYAQSVWNIHQNWEVGARYEWMSGASYDDLDPEWTESRHRVSAQGTFYPSHFSRIRLQTNYDRPNWRPRPIVSVMLGLEVSIGAHGAHKF